MACQGILSCESVSAIALVGLDPRVYLGVPLEIVCPDEALIAVIAFILSIPQVGLHMRLYIFLSAEPLVAAGKCADPLVIHGVGPLDIGRNLVQGDARVFDRGIEIGVEVKISECCRPRRQRRLGRRRHLARVSGLWQQWGRWWDGDLWGLSAPLEVPNSGRGNVKIQGFEKIELPKGRCGSHHALKRPGSLHRDRLGGGTVSWLFCWRGRDRPVLVGKVCRPLQGRGTRSYQEVAFKRLAKFTVLVMREYSSLCLVCLEGVLGTWPSMNPGSSVVAIGCWCSNSHGNWYSPWWLAMKDGAEFCR